MSESRVAEAELERFRRQWKEEVSSRNRAGPSATAQKVRSSTGVDRRKPTSHPKDPVPSSAAVQQRDEIGGFTYHDLPDKEEALKLGASEKGLVRPGPESEPQTALEHYEKAVEREAAGKLGDSLRLYRKAFRMDDNVHEKYKNKHFPPSSQPSKPTQTNPSGAPVTVPNPAHHSLHGLPPTVSQLIEDFASLSIPSLPPPTEASPAPPCPLAGLPEEILSHILYLIGTSNIAAFPRLALVCKKLAYLSMTEEQTWKAVVLSRHQGFGGMLYTYKCDVQGRPLPDHDGHEQPLDASPNVTTTPPIPSPSDTITTHLLTSVYLSSWRTMYRLRPRIRFHGLYISTVNYTRPGAASATINTWSTPVHVVTYYRYLRFYRDGTCISLLSTSEPQDVVHILTKDHLLPLDSSSDPHKPRRTTTTTTNHHLHAPSAAAGSSTSSSSSSSAAAGSGARDHALPAHQIMRDALRGRWRLSGPGEGEGEVQVETEGAVPKYVYRMRLAVGSGTVVAGGGGGGGGGGGPGPKRGGSNNNKLSWKGYWCWNRLTDDWAEFGLKNDRPFWWSRVRSYGTGG